MKKKYGFYVSGKATRLFQIIEKCPEIIENTFIVVNDGEYNSALSNFFRKKNITYLQVNYKNVTKKERNQYISDILLEEFQFHKLDFVFCFGARLLKGNVLKVFKNRIVNFHPSILPMYPGEKSIDKAINDDAFLVGNTAHFIDAGIDTGPVIIQNIIKYQKTLSYEDILSQQIPMIYQIYCWLNQDRISVTNNKTIIKDCTTNSTFFPSLEVNITKH